MDSTTKGKIIGGPGAPNRKNRDLVGDKFGLGGRTVSKAKNVLEKGCKQLQQAVRDDRITVKLAEKIAKSLDIEEQPEVVAVAMVASTTKSRPQDRP